MLINYRILINIIYFLSPIIIILILIKKKKTFIVSEKSSVFLQKDDLMEALFGYMEQVLENFRVLCL